ncbi:MAG: hypothetical protein K1X79_05580 [Oligoflexia bacterium]|nr:hypothetical protein [Oligoflexia bacterium]
MRRLYQSFDMPPRHRIYQSNTGSSLLAVLLYLTFLANCVGLLLWTLSDNQRRRTTIAHAQQTHFETAAAAMAKLGQQAIPKKHRFTCLEAKYSSGRVDLTRRFCADIPNLQLAVLHQPLVVGARLAAPNTFPYLDLDAIFRNSRPCPTTFFSAPKSSSFNFTLTPESFVAQALCRAPTLALAYSGNIEISQPLALGSPGSPSLLAARGYIDIASSLMAQGPLLVVAAGDLHIHELQSPHAVTLVSMTGTLVIDGTRGNPNLKLLAWKDIQAPATIGTADNGLYPVVLSGQGLSMTSARIP